MKKKLIFCLIAFLSLFLTGCSEKYITEGTKDAIKFKETEEVTNYVKIEMSNNDIMILELYPDIAPITVENFQNLIKEHFYDNLTFHRIVKDFMIQGGASTSENQKETIIGEFKENGVKNNLSHERGVISMARSNDKNSASTQFFICHADSPHLDGNYAGFGKLIAGFDVLDKLADTKVNGETPVNPPKIKTIRFVTIEKNVSKEV